ncbi:Mitochondrial tRNAs modification protein [Cytospora paraplurivora]|uniref:Mitochondrial tRNAs modification protein n=1 Tax=Cytospora paraplurivora TaxID=2898453 RepID=A0AAN9U5J1_9PEZI
MESAIQRGNDPKAPVPHYPFLTLLVSGGHTMLLHTTSNVDHRILASTQRGRVELQEKESPVAIGDMLDKCARAIVPVEAFPQKAESVIYGQLMEDFVRNSKYNGMLHHAYKAPEKRQDEIEVYRSKEGWILPPPLRLTREMKYDFSGLGGMVRSIMQNKPDMSRQERAELAYHTMRLAFEHLASRVILALQEDEKLLAEPPKHLVLSGGVASNKFLRKVIEAVLKARGFDDIQLIAPHPKWCTDNAAMIAWTGAKMYESGWTTDRTFLPMGEWPIEQIMTGADCWVKRRDLSPFDPGYNTNEQQDVTDTPESTTPTTAEPVAPQVPADQPIKVHTTPATASAYFAALQVPAVYQPNECPTTPATAPAGPITSQVPVVDQALAELSTPETVAKPVSQTRRQRRREEQRQAAAQLDGLGAKLEEDRKARLEKEKEQAEVAKLEEDRKASLEKEKEQAEVAKQKAKEKAAEVAKQKAKEKEAKIAKQKAKEEAAKVAKQKKAEMARQKAKEKEAEEARQRAKEKEARIAKQKAREEEAKIAKQNKAEMAKQKVEQIETGPKQAKLSDEDRKQYIKQEAEPPSRGPGPFAVRKVSSGSRGSTRPDHGSEGNGGRTTTSRREGIDRGAPLASLDKVPPQVHIVRRLRPLQPAAAADQPTTKSAMGSLQKGLSTLKRWVGL